MICSVGFMGRAERRKEGVRYLGRSAARREVVLQPVNRRRRSWHLVILPEDPEVALSAEVDIFC